MSDFEISPMSRPRRAPWVESRQEAESFTLFSTRNNVETYLNESAQLIWQLCDGDNTFEGIVALFVDAFPNSNTVASDLSEIIRDLQKQGLLLLDGGDAAREYQGGIVRSLTPSVELLWQLEKVRQFMFSILRLSEQSPVESDFEELLGNEALKAAKKNDADSASVGDSSVVRPHKILQAPSVAALLDTAIVEISAMLPEIDSAIELSGDAIYLPGSHMGWHSNHSRSDGRIYCSWAKKDNSNFFRYEDPLTGEIVTQWEQAGWNIKSFTIPPPNARFWHCIGANSLRFSIGFRYNLPN